MALNTPPNEQSLNAEKPFSTSKVTVEYSDPHDVFKLVSPNLLPRLPLRHLNWQSHSGPIRSIDTLHIDLIPLGETPKDINNLSASFSSSTSTPTPDDGFTPAATTGSAKHSSLPTLTPTTSISDQPPSNHTSLPPSRRHQIPGLRKSPYLKLLFVRCDDPDVYKDKVRPLVKTWLATHTPKEPPSRKLSKQEGHEATEWLIVHVVLPNTVAATQPRTTSRSSDNENRTVVKWRGGRETLLEKMRSDFNGKSSVDRVAQIRIGVNDVPYDLLPRVVPAVPSGYVETRADVEAAWADFIAKVKNQILSSFDTRVHFYEDDIKEKDGQRAFAGWNFNTFFILKEGLARGFESVGLVEDALVGYDELSAGLDAVVTDAGANGTMSLLLFTSEMKTRAEASLASLEAMKPGELEAEEAAQKRKRALSVARRDYQDLPISATKKSYRELILANNVSLFDFRCYIFARQIALLSRLGNVLSTREELLAKLHSMQEAITPGVVPLTIATAPKDLKDDSENLAMLAEICRRTLAFIPVISSIMRDDIIAAFKPVNVADADYVPDAALLSVTETMVSAFAFAVAQQILAQTGTAALPIPPPSTPSTPTTDSTMALPDPPHRRTSLKVTVIGNSGKPPPSPGLFPSPATQEAMAAAAAAAHKQQVKNGLDDLSARRAELYSLCRNVLEQLGRKKGWDNGWEAAPSVMFEAEGVADDMEEVDLSDNAKDTGSPTSPKSATWLSDEPASSGFPTDLTSLSRLLAVALSSKSAFYRLYATLTDKALRHYTIAGYDSAVQSHMADLGVLHMFLDDPAAATPFLAVATEFFGDRGWSAVELTLLVLYTRALQALNRKEEFVRIGMKLLTKAALCRQDARTGGVRTGVPSRVSSGTTTPIPISALTPLAGLVTEVIAVSKTLSMPKRIALADFFCGAEIAGPVEYVDGSDQFVLSLVFRSLLLEELSIEKATLRMGATSGVTRTIVLSAKGAILGVGRSRVSFTGSAAIPGPYKVEHLVLTSGKLQLIWDLSSLPPDTPSTLFTAPNITLFQRTSAFSLDITAAPESRLHAPNHLDLTISPGWNTLTTASVTVKPSTSGLRLLTSAAKILTSDVTFVKKPEGGTFRFVDIPAHKDVIIRFPYTLDTESASSIILRLESSYNTATTTYAYARSKTVDISLTVGVNVQDVFKHTALFSRFTVSANSGPLRLFESQLTGDENSGYKVESAGLIADPKDPTVIFMKQPASILYRITRPRLEGIAALTLTLRYTLVRNDVSSALINAIEAALPEALHEYALLLREIAAFSITALGIYDLEKALLLGYLPTNFLSSIHWATELTERAGLPGSIVSELLSFITAFIAATPHLPIPPGSPQTIHIPVDVPHLPLVITATLSSSAMTPSLNTPLPTTLTLRATRRWAEKPPADDGLPIKPASTEDKHIYTYDLATPPDTYLLGGHRKGTLYIPNTLTTPKFDIPLILIPLRAGPLSYPAVEIRPVSEPEVVEIDNQNLGEVVKVVVDRGLVTLSLDASGPGGGPLVLESEEVLS